MRFFIQDKLIDCDINKWVYFIFPHNHHDHWCLYHNTYQSLKHSKMCPAYGWTLLRLSPFIGDKDPTSMPERCRSCLALSWTVRQMDKTLPTEDGNNICTIYSMTLLWISMLFIIQAHSYRSGAFITPLFFTTKEVAFHICRP